MTCKMFFKEKFAYLSCKNIYNVFKYVFFKEINDSFTVLVI